MQMKKACVSLPRGWIVGCIEEERGMPRPCSTFRDLRGANPALPGPGSAAGVSRQRQQPPRARQSRQPTAQQSPHCAGQPLFVLGLRYAFHLIFWFMRVASDSSCPCSGSFPDLLFRLRCVVDFPVLHFIAFPFSAISAVSAASRVSPHAWGCIYRLDHLGWWHASPGK